MFHKNAVSLLTLLALVPLNQTSPHKKMQTFYTNYVSLQHIFLYAVSNVILFQKADPPVMQENGVFYEVCIHIFKVFEK